MRRPIVRICILLIFISLCSCQSLSYTHVANAPGEGDYVVLLHGLARSANYMKDVEDYLAKQPDDFVVINISYPSLDYPVEKLASDYVGKTINNLCLHPNKKVNFVTHSLGGVVLREFLKQSHSERVGKIVMLAPPNKGSELADIFERCPFAQWLVGPTLGQLVTYKNGYLDNLGPVIGEVGVITGDMTYNPFGSLLEGKDDGMVSVERSMVKGMVDHFVYPTNHAFIASDQKCLKQVYYFLKNGKFDHQ